MELALRTGWTPDVLGSLPGTFRRACHWRLWVGSVVGPDGISDPATPPAGSDPSVTRAWADSLRAVREVRAGIYPEGE